MKAFKYITTVAFVLLCSCQLMAQNKKQKKEAEVKNMLQNKNFTFVAQYVNPIGGRERYLNYDYDVRIKPDSVISYLPYFGQVTFDPPLYPNDDGIKFKSTHYGYHTRVLKHGSYEIDITPTDAGYVQRFLFTISPDGYAFLQVTITNRSFISYNGYITEDPSSDNIKNAPKTAKN